MNIAQKFRKSLVLTGIGLSLVMLAAPSMVMAATDPYQAVCANGGAGSAVCNGGGADPIAGTDGVVVKVTSILAVVAGVVSVIFLVWGGVKYITSGGDSSGVSSAKSTIIAALVGLVIAALARPIITFVIGKL